MELIKNGSEGTQTAIYAGSAHHQSMLSGVRLVVTGELEGSFQQRIRRIGREKGETMEKFPGSRSLQKFVAGRPGSLIQIS